MTGDQHHPRIGHDPATEPRVFDGMLGANRGGPVNVSRALGLAIWGHPIPQHAWAPLDYWAAELVTAWPSITAGDIADHQARHDHRSVATLAQSLITEHRARTGINAHAQLQPARAAIAAARGRSRW